MLILLRLHKLEWQVLHTGSTFLLTSNCWTAILYLQLRAIVFNITDQHIYLCYKAITFFVRKGFQGWLYPCKKANRIITCRQNLLLKACLALWKIVLGSLCFQIFVILCHVDVKGYDCIHLYAGVSTCIFVLNCQMFV